MSYQSITLEESAKSYVNNLIYRAASGLVMTGPFEGMKVLEEVAWEDGNLGTKVLGCYEQELHGFIESEIKRLKELDRPPRILDLGCSEGYYAVGMARRLPGAHVIAMDQSEEALRITQAAAMANGVPMQTTKECPYDFEPDTVICDCEGGEITYLDMEKFPALKRAVIMVECHDNEDNPYITESMANRFEKTHVVYVVNEGARDPNQFECLIRLGSLMRWLAVSEGRPCRMHWLLMGPKENL